MTASSTTAPRPGDLLPPNATALERDISRSINSLARIAAPLPRLRRDKRGDIPDALIPWLLHEYGLGDLLPFHPSPRNLLDDGLALQRRRGTPAAITTILSWQGLQATVHDRIECHSRLWVGYHIELAQPLDDIDALQRLQVATALVQPLRSRLIRIVSGYDRRRVVLDQTRLSDGSLLSDHSGVRPPELEGVQLSYGQQHQMLVRWRPVVRVQARQPHHALARLRSHFMLSGASRLAQHWHTLSPCSSLRLITGRTVSRSQLCVWDERPWTAGQSWGRCSSASAIRHAALTSHPAALS
ncbi:MAG: hypothetical protein ERJ68_00085 [Aphanocapsa feldmannii 277cI]|uniref:Phage tail protein n=1 Tax=Aphanocapsa feldmannii 277cI TaxID=2507554 RepID=A0A524RW17_9CHRO|nr:MAG: hypothetical protein ERJ68_00085 [Aphanocapsa feldmannii 277cI]